MPTVRKLDAFADPRWDAYVRAHPGRTLYHLGAWARVLERAYGFRPRYLALEEDGELRGVLPLSYKRGLLSDARLRSIPVFSYGGPLADGPGEEALLLEAARALARRDAARGMSINTGPRRLAAPGFEAGEILPRWVVGLPGDLDALRAGWRKTESNLFRSLRKADAAELELREATEPWELRAFQNLYAQTMRRHRSLPRTLRQLRLARRHLPDAVKVFVVDYDSWIVAAGVYHVFGDRIELVYNGSHESALGMRPNHFLYWEVMRWAAARGLRHVDLGGAYAGTPLARFKEQWGARPEARFRLEHRPAGATRAESLAALGYGAEASERRLTDLAWRHVPIPALRAAGHLAYRYA